MIIDNLEYALKMWNDNMSTIRDVLTKSPEEFSSGIWVIIGDINDALKAMGLGLVVVFFLMGVVKSSASFVEFKRPELVLKTLLRLGIAKSVVTYGLDIMGAIFNLVRGLVDTVLDSTSISVETIALPQEIADATEKLKFLESILAWALTFLGAIVIIVLSFIMIMTVYSRFFKLYLYSAISPLPMATFAGEPTSMVGKAFIKSYVGVCLEGLVVIIACIIFGAFASTAPELAADASASSLLWSYLGHTILNFLVLALAVKTSDRLCREMLGL